VLSSMPTWSVAVILNEGEQGMPGRPARQRRLIFKTGRPVNQNYLVIGQVTDAGGGQYNVQFQLFDV